MPRKRKSKNYFSKITQAAIVGYNQSDNLIKKEKIYKRFIYPAFMKLAENMINNVKPGYIKKSFPDLQIDLVTYLTERLNKFNPESGKAYSYYTRTSWNYLVAENKKAYKKTKNKVDPLTVDEDRNVLTELSNTEMQENIKQFMDDFVEYCYNNLNSIFSSSIDIHVADSVLHFFAQREYIEDFNKKSLYILIRERCQRPTPNVTKVVNTLKKLYEDKFHEYAENKFVNTPF